MGNTGFYKWVDKNGNVHYGDAPVVNSDEEDTMNLEVVGETGITRSSGETDPGCMAKIQEAADIIKVAKGDSRKELEKALLTQKDNYPLPVFIHSLFSVLEKEEKTMAKPLLTNVLIRSVAKRPEATNALIDALNHPCACVRELAAVGLERVDSKEAIPPIIDGLKTKKNEEVRAALAQALLHYNVNLKYNESQTLEIARIMEKESSPGVKAKIAELLGWTENQKVLPSLISMLGYPQMEVRAKAAFSIAMIKNKKDFSPSLEKELIEGLNQYGDKSMAWSFVNYGSLQMQDAAKNWAKAHGYSVRPAGHSW